MFEDGQDESPRKTGKFWPILLGAAALLIILVSLLVWHFRPGQATPASSQATASSIATTVATGTSSTDVKTGAGDPPIYWQTIEQNIAQELHLTVAQVKARLQPPPGGRDSLGIAHVASEQGISEAQLRVNELNAIQKGHDLLVRMGILTQQGSDLGMQRIRNWDQMTLDDHVTGWFLNN